MAYRRTARREGLVAGLALAMLGGQLAAAEPSAGGRDTGACRRLAALKEVASNEFAAQKSESPSRSPEGHPMWDAKGLPRLAFDDASQQWLGCFIVDTSDYIARNCILRDSEGMGPQQQQDAVLARAKVTAACFGLDENAIGRTEGGWLRVSPDGVGIVPRVVFAYSSQPGVFLYMLMRVRRDGD